MSNQVNSDIRALKVVRRRLALSQEKVAHQMGVSLSTYRRWEQGLAKPTSEAMQEVLRSFVKRHTD